MDNRTPEEIAYDNLKSGAAYVKPAVQNEAEFVRGYQVGSLLGEYIKLLVQPLPAVTSEVEGCDDAQWTNYRAGAVEIAVDNKSAPIAYLFGLDSIAVEELAATLPAIVALLADPRVQAAREYARVACLPTLGAE